MKKILMMRSYQLTIFIIVSILIEVLTFHMLGFGNIPEYISFDICLYVFFGSIVFFFKSNWASTTFLSSMIFIELLLFFVNLTLYNIYGDVFSIQQLFRLGEGKEVFSTSFISIKNIFICIGILLGFIALMVAPNFFVSTKKQEFNFMFRLAIVLVVLFSTFGIYDHKCKKLNKDNAQKYQALLEGTKYDYMQYYASSSRVAAFQKFGLLTFYMKEYEAMEVNKTIDDEYNTLRNHLTQIQKTDNSMTGILKGKNVISIMIESGQSFAINEYLTPTLYKLQNEGLNFLSNYSKNRTDHSEFIGICGSCHSNDLYTGSIDYKLPFTLPNILKSTYKTSYFHDNEGTFYWRNYQQPQLGFENCYFIDDIYPGEEHWDWGKANYTPDSKTAAKILPNLISTDEPFYSFWTTLTTHGPYDYSSVNKAFYTEQGYFEEIDKALSDGKWVNKGIPGGIETKYRYYQAAMMDLDRGVELIVNKLIEEDLLDDTLIVMYGDHQAYYDGFECALNCVGTSEQDRSNPILYETTMIMYNPILTKKYINVYGNNDVDKFTTPYVIVPTILDLLGVKYNANIYAGQSLFDSSYNQVLYSNQNGCFFNEKVYSMDGFDIKYRFGETTKEEEKAFLEACKTFLLRKKYCDEIYDKNIFSYANYITFNYR